MTAKPIRLNYASVDQFLRHYAHLIKGRLFLGSKPPLPANAAIALQITVPGIAETMQIEATVLKSLDPAMAARLNKPTGMLIGFSGTPSEALRGMQQTLAANPHYRALLDLPDQTPDNPPLPAPPPTTGAPASREQGAPSPYSPAQPDAAAELTKPATESSASAMQTPDADPRGSESPEPALSMEWIRDAVAQEEAVGEEEEAPQDIGAAVAEKKDLTPQERSRIKPVADFIMDLTKAMLRTGYYAADHPGAKNAKRGLFEAFRRSLGEAPEIMLTSRDTREKNDILISGILNEPVNVRTLVGAGMAELFVPKLREYFTRKGLVSFAIKKSIAAEHFEGFVDIMSDPTADRGANARIGAQLSKALAARGITAISTVFIDDIIALEMNLPWRVEMAIQRLAKDLKVLPMFRAESDDRIKQMKLQIIQDIIRPLKHPEFLKDLIINCYVIANHLEGLESEDVEKVIIEAFPLESLLPTSRLIFGELQQLKDKGSADPAGPSIRRRFEAVKRILKWIARRLVLEDVSGAQRFLGQLYQNGLLRFEELPADVQYLVNTTRMAADVQAHPRRYAGRLLKSPTAADAETILRCFRRVVPHFMHTEDWRTLYAVSQAAVRFSTRAAAAPARPRAGRGPARYRRHAGTRGRKRRHRGLGGSRRKGSLARRQCTARVCAALRRVDGGPARRDPGRGARKRPGSRRPSPPGRPAGTRHRCHEFLPGPRPNRTGPAGAGPQDQRTQAGFFAAL